MTIKFTTIFLILILVALLISSQRASGREEQQLFIPLNTFGPILVICSQGDGCWPPTSEDLGLTAGEAVVFPDPPDGCSLEWAFSWDRTDIVSAGGPHAGQSCGGAVLTNGGAFLQVSEEGERCTGEPEAVCIHNYLTQPGGSPWTDITIPEAFWGQDSIQAVAFFGR